MRSIFALALAAALCTPCALGQNFNIDVGDDPTGLFGAPATTYPGAAAQPGVWNRLQDGAIGVNVPPLTSVPWYTTTTAGGTTLVDVTGAATTVTTSVAVAPAGNNGLGDFEFNNSQTFTDDQALYDDLADIGNAGIVGSMHVWTISNLQNGNYDVYTYAWAPDSATFTTRVSAANSTSSTQTSGGAWPGGHVLGTNYTLHTVTVNAGTITITVESLAGFGSCNGIQLKKLGSGPGTAYCEPGAAGVIACPCGNNPTAGSGQGCTNSLGAGATISGAGTASVAASTVVISASGIGSSGAACSGSVTALTCILLQGNANAPGGIAFNDGVRCFSGSLKRIETGTSSGGVFTSTVNIATTSAALGDTIGATTFDRYYGVWHRDPCATWACASPLNSNVTNSYTIVWVP